MGFTGFWPKGVCAAQYFSLHRALVGTCTNQGSGKLCCGNSQGSYSSRNLKFQGFYKTFSGQNNEFSGHNFVQIVTKIYHFSGIRMFKSTFCHKNVKYIPSTVLCKIQRLLQDKCILSILPRHSRSEF